MQSEELAWLEYYKKAGISWLAPMTVELIKLAYFAGMKAAQQQLAPDAGESAASTDILQASAESTSQAEPTPTQRG